MMNRVIKWFIWPLCDLNVTGTGRGRRGRGGAAQPRELEVEHHDIACTVTRDVYLVAIHKVKDCRETLSQIEEYTLKDVD